MKHSIFISLLLLKLSVHAQSGSLDPTFGIGGKIVTDIGGNDDAGWSVAIQSDAKIIVAGYSNNSIDSSCFALIRYNSDGSLDNTFGSAGKVTTTFGSANCEAYSVAIQGDEKIIVAGSIEVSGGRDVGLARYNNDGSIDNTFDYDGKVSLDFGRPLDSGYSVVIQTDGKILLTGTSGFWYDYDFAIARFNSNGSLDSTFGAVGKVITSIGSYIDISYSLVIQNDGKIVVSGQSWNNIDETYSFAVLRFNNNGSLDNSFGTNGIVITDFANFEDYGNSISVQNDGKIVVSGLTGPYGNYDFGLVRYNSDGSLDNSFGTGGKVKTTIGVNANWKNSVAIQSDGKILVAGFSNNSPNNDFILVLYNGDGSLDNTFGSGGIVTTDFGSYDDRAYSAAIQGDGKIVVTGTSYNGTDFDFAIARYNNSGTVSAEQNNEMSDVNLYPNPTTGILSMLNYRNAEIYIYDLFGNCLLDKMIMENNIKEIDLTFLPKGTYYIELITKGKKSIEKVILN